MLRREIEGPLSEAGIELVDLAVERGCGRFEGPSLAQGDVAGGPVLRHLARVDFVAEVAVDDPVRPGG